MHAHPAPEIGRRINSVIEDSNLGGIPDTPERTIQNHGVSNSKLSYLVLRKRRRQTIFSHCTLPASQRLV